MYNNNLAEVYLLYSYWLSYLVVSHDPNFTDTVLSLWTYTVELGNWKTVVHLLTLYSHNHYQSSVWTDYESGMHGIRVHALMKYCYAWTVNVTNLSDIMFDAAIDYRGSICYKSIHRHTPLLIDEVCTNNAVSYNNIERYHVCTIVHHAYICMWWVSGEHNEETH